MSSEFHINLKIARQNKGFSQKEVADSIGVAKSTYSLYESGNREPGVPTIKKLAALLEVSTDDLLGIHSEEEPFTLAAHFDGDEYTEEELEKIREFAAFVRSNRK